ncbi:hypothetical protein HY628_02700 [Candidatus Uhrbacteria bacterium]|nr:hypothetical protein [Candidatus Uhrbacteria bacterium]
MKRFLILVSFLTPLVTQAGTVVQLQSPINAPTVQALAGDIIRAVLGLVGSLALIMFIYGGFLWLTSGGNPDKIKQGRDTLIWAAIGLVFIFSSYIVARFVLEALSGL